MSEYKHTVYVVIPMGDPTLPANDDDLRTVQDAIEPLRSRTITEASFCSWITTHLQAAAKP